MRMLTLYDYLDSGNGYKVRLLLHQQQRPFRLVEKDILAGETRTPDFLRINPNGRIPVLETEDGRHLAESNAILYYLAGDTPFLPGHPFARAQTLQWMGFEQYSHEPNIATPRFWLQHGPLTDERRSLLEVKRPLGYAALDVMEGHLTAREFFVEDRYSIADIALYAYTHVADEGGFELSGYPAIARWLKRVRGQPRHVPIDWRP